jgi:hypothetical protein
MAGDGHELPGGPRGFDAMSAGDREPQRRAARGDLIHFEQCVNDRQLTSDAPDIARHLLPEGGAACRLAWRRLPRQAVDTFAIDESIHSAVASGLVRDDIFLMPVHPLEEERYAADELEFSGRMRVSASYRTVFYEPEPGGPLYGWSPQPGQSLMLKLHLQAPLPGIPGDRRLTRDKVEKCVVLSRALPDEMARQPLARGFEVIPEIFGAAHADAGLLIRAVPTRGLMPAFSLYSNDRSAPEAPTAIAGSIRHRFGDDAAAAADRLGEELAAPLVGPVLAGFRAGFALEMHGQNTLLRLGRDMLIERVYFRDLEGVVFSDRFRVSRGLPPLFPGSGNPELLWDGDSMRRWFNRNIDHDLGRIFTGALDALCEAGVFARVDRARAVRSIRRTVRRLIRLAGLNGLAWPGRVLPVVRSPYGSGTRLGHYYRTRYR